MLSNCELVQLASQPTLSIRMRTAVQELPQVLGKGYGDIAQYLGKIKEQPAGPPFAIYYNMDMQDLDVEFGFPVSRNLQAQDNIHPGETPSGKSASCLHVGLYSELKTTYNALFQWMKDNRYEATGVAYEVYLNDPDQTPQEKIKILIHLLIKD
jgi:effector-binding domain-containing protein